MNTERFSQVIDTDSPPTTSARQTRSTVPMLSAGYGKLLILLTIMLLLPLTGCGIQLGNAGKGSLTIDSRAHDELDIGSTFQTGYYSVDDRNTITFVLISGQETNPTSAAIIRVFWKPVAGATTVDRTATNSTLQLLVFGTSLSNQQAAAPLRADTQQAGLYSGAGFVYLNNKPGYKKLSAGIWEANLLLADRSEDFNDLIGPSVLRGAISAQHDDAKVNQLLNRLSQLLSARLGYPRMVSAEGE